MTPDFAGAPCTKSVYPDMWQSTHPLDQAEAIRICHTCTQQLPCFKWALSNGESGAVWGGHWMGPRPEHRKRLR